MKSFKEKIKSKEEKRNNIRKERETVDKTIEMYRQIRDHVNGVIDLISLDSPDR